MVQLSDDETGCESVFDDELLDDHAPTRVSMAPRRPLPRGYARGVRPELVRSGDVLAGKYRVERVHRASANGVTVEALHTELGQRVAVRLLALDPVRHPEAKARFLRGAKLAVRYQNAHTARIVDVGSLDSGVPYRATELLSGADLERVLRVRNVLPVPEAVDYLLQACEGLADAHFAGVAHRNLKPSNLFITRARGRRHLVVLDLGTSEDPAGFGARAGRTQRAFPGLTYLAPEQIREPQLIDVRADVWALGAILHEMLAGNPLYEAESTQTLMAMIVAEPDLPVSRMRQDVPAELEAVLSRCLTTDRSGRYASARELASALAPFASAAGEASVRRMNRASGRASSHSTPPPLPGSGSRAIVRVGAAELPKALPTIARSGPRWGELVLTAVGLATAGAVGVFVAVHVMEGALAASLPARPVVAELSPALPARAPSVAPPLLLSAATSATPPVLAPATAHQPVIVPAIRRSAPLRVARSSGQVALARRASAASSSVQVGPADPLPGLFDDAN